MTNPTLTEAIQDLLNPGRRSFLKTSAAGAAASTRFFGRFAAGGSHAGFLTAAELR